MCLHHITIFAGAALFERMMEEAIFSTEAKKTEIAIIAPVLKRSRSTERPPSPATVPLHHDDMDATSTKALLWPGMRHLRPLKAENQRGPALQRGLKLLRQGRLVIACYANFFPVCYKTDYSCPRGPSYAFPGSRGVAGLEVDLLVKFCEKVGLEPHFIEVQSFDGIWTLPARGLSDVAIGGITSSSSRYDPGTSWTSPYFKVNRTLIYHKRWPLKRSFPEGAVGVIRATPGSTGYLDAEARMTDVGKLYLLRDSCDDENDIYALLKGRIQGMIRGSAVAKAIVARFPDQLAIMEPWEILPQFRPTQQGEVFSLPTRSGSTLSGLLSSFLRHESQNGNLHRLLEKHRLI